MNMREVIKSVLVERDLIDAILREFAWQEVDIVGLPEEGGYHVVDMSYKGMRVLKVGFFRIGDGSWEGIGDGSVLRYFDITRIQ